MERLSSSSSQQSAGQLQEIHQIEESLESLRVKRHKLILDVDSVQLVATQKTKI